MFGFPPLSYFVKANILIVMRLQKLSVQCSGSEFYKKKKQNPKKPHKLAPQWAEGCQVRSSQLVQTAPAT